MNNKLAWLLLLGLGVSGCAGLKTQSQDKELDIPEKSPANVFTKLGKEYLDRGQNDLALKNFKLALKEDSGNSEAHNAIAILYERLNQKDRAEYHLEKAVSLRPSNASAQTNYGNLLCSKGQYGDADDHFKKAIDTPLYKTPWIALTNAGICAQAAGRKGEAEEYLRRALKIRPAFAPALLAMAKLSFDNGNALSGRAFLQRYLARTKFPSADALLLGVKVEQALGDSAAENQFRSELESRFPDSKEAKSLPQ